MSYFFKNYHIAALHPYPHLNPNLHPFFLATCSYGKSCSPNIFQSIDSRVKAMPLPPWFFMVE